MKTLIVLLLATAALSAPQRKNVDWGELGHGVGEVAHGLLTRRNLVDWGELGHGVGEVAHGLLTRRQLNQLFSEEGRKLYNIGGMITGAAEIVSGLTARQLDTMTPRELFNVGEVIHGAAEIVHAVTRRNRSLFDWGAAAGAAMDAAHGAAEAFLRERRLVDWGMVGTGVVDLGMATLGFRRQLKAIVKDKRKMMNLGEVMHGAAEIVHAVTRRQLKQMTPRELTGLNRVVAGSASLLRQLNWVSDAWDTVSGFASDAWDATKSAVGAAADWVSDAVSRNRNLVDWGELGHGVGEVVHGVLTRRQLVDWGELGHGVGEVAHGLLTRRQLKKARKMVDWGELGHGVGEMVHGVITRRNLKKARKMVDWGELGHGVAEVVHGLTRN